MTRGGSQQIGQPSSRRIWPGLFFTTCPLSRITTTLRNTCAVCSCSHCTITLSALCCKRNDFCAGASFQRAPLLRVVGILVDLEACGAFFLALFFDCFVTTVFLSFFLFSFRTTTTRYSFSFVRRRQNSPSRQSSQNPRHLLRDTLRASHTSRRPSHVVHRSSAHLRLLTLHAAHHPSPIAHRAQRPPFPPQFFSRHQ